MKRRLIATVGVALCLTGCGILPTEEEFDAAPVLKEYEGASFNKVTVTRGTLEKTEEISGKYKGTVKEDIEPDGASVIKKIYVKKGDRVKAGDVVMQYELPGSEKTLKESNEKIEKTKLQITQARELMKLEVEKQKKIGGGSKEIANARNQYEQQIKALESSLELLKMDAQIAKEEIEEEQITASVNGVVTYVDSKAEGTYGTEGEAAIKIEGKKKNRFEANSKYASHCKEGDIVTIEVRGQEYKATVKKDPESTDSVYFYPRSKLNLEDGTVCSYQVILKEKKDILYLPSSIVYSMGDKHVVYYEDANGLKSTKEVSIGETIDNFVEITAGLEENEQVIAN
ncbi:MAG: efflux RND transporter periplasmic adaptor subunit [Clostridiales bacterium]|nr:efflux RND transporter periplasmic adaptor subunit [Clostridiales bacterium]